MHILSATILQMVTDRENIAVANKFNVTYGLFIGIFSFDLGTF